MDGSWLDNPLVQSAALPLVVALVVTGVLRLLAGPGRGPLLAGAAVAIGFLAAYLSIVGLPPWPPRASDQKLAYAVSAGVVLGLVLDSVRVPRLVHWLAVVAGAAAVLAWIGWPRLRAGELEMTLRVAALWLGGAVALLRLHRQRLQGAQAGAMLLVVSAGAAPVAFYGASLSLAQFAGALAAAAGGFLLWSWPLSHYRFGSAGVLGAGSALLTVLGIMGLYTQASPAALALLLPAFFADALSARVPLPAGTLGSLLRPIVLALFCAVPVAAAIAVAYIAAGGGDSAGYYG